MKTLYTWVTESGQTRVTDDPENPGRSGGEVGFPDGRDRWCRDYTAWRGAENDLRFESTRDIDYAFRLAFEPERRSTARQTGLKVRQV